ncbi:hypothetical protein NMY22_g12212 [Coprinellus aureogranulatus]|nr:hypothetical protein NMY22_g12212 [Coprinellus aureogranulatus]
MGAFIISLSYGIPVKSRGDPHLAFSESTNEMLGKIMTPGANFIDVFPILKHIPTWAPGAHYNRKVKELSYMSEQFRSAPFDEALSKFGTGEARPSFVSTALSALEDGTGARDTEHQKQVIKDTAAMFYMAGTDTIVASILNWIWALLKNPEVQSRVHAELDEVVKGRMPEYDDQDRLPYLMATLMESARWAPATPIGVPHTNTEDDVYDGYLIPKDTIVIANLWAMLRNEGEYANGATYDPSRFLTPAGTIDEGVRDPYTVVFGFGRRACPGAHIGRSTVWLLAASLAKLFKWTEPLGEDGKPIDQPMDFERGMVYQPNRFKCDFKIRSAEAELLQSTLEA